MERYAFSECWDDYRFGALQGPLIAVFGCAFGTRTERGDRMFAAMVTRSCAAIRELDSVYVNLILPATYMPGGPDPRPSRLPETSCDTAGSTVPHTDASDAGQDFTLFTPSEADGVGTLRRTRRCRGLPGVGPVLSPHLRTGACSVVRISRPPARVRTEAPRPRRARLARFTPAT